MSPKRSTSAATPFTEDSTDSTSPSPTIEAAFPGAEARGIAAAAGVAEPGRPVKRFATADDEAQPTGGTAGEPARRSRFAWAVTGSGHYLVESMELAHRLPNVDLFLSAAAEEVLPLYGYRMDSLKEHFRVFRDKTASSVPVGMLYDDVYHTVVLAPATSNTVAKCAFGISDTLPTNMFAQAGKLAIPGIVFACDTEPVVVTKSPREWVELRPRNIELENVARLRRIDFCHVVESVDSLEQALDARLAELSLKWNTLSS